MAPFAGLAGLLDGPAEGDPDRPALIVDDGSPDGAVLTYAGLRGLVDEWAVALASAGVGPGHRVLLADRGGARSTAVTLAAVALGAATAQVNPSLTEPELRALAEVAGCGPVAVAARDAAPATLAALASVHGPAAQVLGGPPPAGAGTPRRPDPDGSADALVLFTSGTTGTPKAVPISDGAVMARMRAYRAPFDPGRGPGRSIMCVPSFHVGGMLGLLLNLFGGDTTVVMPRFDAGRWLELVDRHRVASSFLVPTMLARILDHPDARPGGPADLSSLRVVAYGAAAAPVDLVRRAMERWPDVAFANVFGQTETLGAYTTLGPDDHRDPDRIGSVGRPLPGVELRVVDPATGVDLADGEVGELWVRTAQTVDGAAGDDGWFATGDLARRDVDGYVYPSGRMSDTINRGGEKFGPAEVADAVRTHPAVAEVAVAGVPDDEMGERVGVLVVPVEGAAGSTVDELRDHCRDRLAPHKLPEVLAVVDSLPHNELGKLPRRVVVSVIRGAS